MKPTSRPEHVAEDDVAAGRSTETSQTGSTPAIGGADEVAERRRSAKASEHRDDADGDGGDALAAITRPRCGTRVKVVSPLRWLHSLVTERIAIIGRITVIGKPIAAAKVS